MQRMRGGTAGPVGKGLACNPHSGGVLTEAWSDLGHAAVGGRQTRAPFRETQISGGVSAHERFLGKRKFGSGDKGSVTRVPLRKTQIRKGGVVYKKGVRGAFLEKRRKRAAASRA